ncbi:MAG: Gfo/Idh/MocA family protein [Rhodospirillaceae bacterium]
MINAAIVGLGRWGQNLVNSVQGKSEKIRFVAGVLRHPDKAREYAQKQGLVLHDDLQVVLDDPAIDAIVLATPHTIHARQIMAAAKAGKHVFTEKPFTLTHREAADALRIAQAKKITLAVGYNWRFQPALQEIRRMLDDGRLGKLLHIEGNFCGPSAYRFSKDHWRQSRDEGPGGGMTGRGVHVVDAMLYLAGRADSVYAQSYRLAQDHGIDDTTSMLFRFRNGVTAYLGTIIATAETWRMQVFGSRGWVEVGDVEHLTTWQMRVCYVDPDDLLTHRKPQIVSFPETSTERAELEHFADAVERGELLALPGGDEEHGVAVFEAIIRSASSGEPVTVGAPAKKTTAPAKTKARAAAKKKAAAKKAVKKPAPRKAPAAKKKARGAKPAARKTAKPSTASRRSKAGARRSGRR